jgi:uncharacterized protein (TIGR02145 family)
MKQRDWDWKRRTKMRHKNIKLFVIILFFMGLMELHAQTVQDIGGNVYTIITIGKQGWMKENLKTTRYSNGDSIRTTTPITLDITNEPTPKYQWAYDGDESNVEIYGRLYTWYAAIDDRNICPTGWHVPTDTDWSTLITYLVGESVAGGKLKETGITHWKSPNTGATNESGFTALPGGYRYRNGTFYDIGGTGNWWSSTEVSTINAWCYTMYSNLKNVNKHYGKKTNDLSVRCVRDY